MKLKEFKADLNPSSSKHNFSAHKNVLNKLLVGNLESEFKNRGMEFEDYRRYTKEDDAQRIDWKATLRAHQLLIRQTIEEKAVNVLFMVDASNSMLCSTGDKLKCEYAAELVCGLSWAIQREGNAIGLCMYNEGVIKTLPPKVGTEQYYDIMAEISNPKNYGGGCNLKNAIKQSLALLNTPSLVIIISDFIDQSEGWERYLEIISLKYDLLGMIIRDKRDRRLPKDVGYFTFENPDTKEKILVDTKEYYKKYMEEIKKNEEDIESSFKRAKSTCLILETDEDFFNPLIKFLEKRSRVIV